MTFEEAVSLVDRIKDQVVGAPVKVGSLNLCSLGLQTGKKCMFYEYLSSKGEDEAIDEFIGKSFSVYGRSVTYINPDLPRWDVTVLDDWEKLFIIERGSLFGYLFFTGTKGEQLSRLTTISRILGLLLKLRDIFLSYQYNYLSHLRTVDKRL